MLYRLHPAFPDVFPNPEEAEEDGLLAVGGDLSVPRLLAAYRNGIFPWYGEGQPLLWWSPDPRCVIFPERFRIPRTVRKELREENPQGETELVGGLYGVGLGRAFFGESMFHLRSDASKAALVALMAWLEERDCRLLDCQMATRHILRYGAELIPRSDFLRLLREAVETPPNIPSK